MKAKRQKVFVGLSGGVDSSVSAALLLRAGYDVTGVFIKSWHPDWFPCTWKEDRRDAMRVAAKLGIPFKTFDAEKEYKKEVIDYLLAEYQVGRTPNPDVICNKAIKFGLFLNYAISNGADFIATGHYARVKKENDNYKLLRGLDSDKDQSYFLWALKQKELSRTIFPLGDLKKVKVREMAKKMKLPVFDKPDSQGLCFVGNISMREFLFHYINPKVGKVLDENGVEIGEHDGAFLYTIGQRHGFRVKISTVQNKKVFVIARDIEKNTITVSDKEIGVDLKENCLSDLNWISEKPIAEKVYTAQSRYRQNPFKVRVSQNKVLYEESQSYIAPGQSFVLFDGEICLGGGIIV